MDDILKAYREPTFIDEAVNVIDAITHGFNPYIWLPHNEVTQQYVRLMIELRDLETTEAMLKGQAFGL